MNPDNDISPLSIKVLGLVQSAGLLMGSNQNSNAIANHPNLSSLFYALETLLKAGLLSGATGQVYFNTLLNHAWPHKLASLVKILHTTGLISAELGYHNLVRVKDHPYPQAVSSILEKLQGAHIVEEINQATFDAIRAHPHPVAVARILEILKMRGLLDGKNGQSNFNVLINHSNAFNLLLVVEILHKADLFSENKAQDNYNAIISHAYPFYLAIVLSALMNALFLFGEKGQSYFDSLIQQTSRLFGSKKRRDFWTNADLNSTSLLNAVIQPRKSRENSLASQSASSFFIPSKEAGVPSIRCRYTKS